MTYGIVDDTMALWERELIFLELVKCHLHFIVLFFEKSTIVPKLKAPYVLIIAVSK